MILLTSGARRIGFFYVPLRVAMRFPYKLYKTIISFISILILHSNLDRNRERLDSCSPFPMDSLISIL